MEDPRHPQLRRPQRQQKRPRLTLLSTQRPRLVTRGRSSRRASRPTDRMMRSRTAPRRCDRLTDPRRCRRAKSSMAHSHRPQACSVMLAGHPELWSSQRPSRTPPRCGQVTTSSRLRSSVTDQHRHPRPRTVHWRRQSQHEPPRRPTVGRAVDSGVVTRLGRVAPPCRNRDTALRHPEATVDEERVNMPPRQGPLRRIEQLRRELEAEGKIATPEAEDPESKPIW
jgi:hypothetical protein